MEDSNWESWQLSIINTPILQDVKVFGCQAVEMYGYEEVPLHVENSLSNDELHLIHMLFRNKP